MTPLDTLVNRRHRLAAAFHRPVVLWSGQPLARNFPANTYYFRANSHFLYLVGRSLARAAIYLNQGQLTLFIDDPPAGADLWHGPEPQRQELAEAIGAIAAYPLKALPPYLAEAATLPIQDWPERLPAHDSQWHQQLALAMVETRLYHDSLAQAEMTIAARVSMAAHRAGMAATRAAQTEAQVRAAMEAVILGHNLSCAYNSIVTIQGEVLHNPHYHHALTAGDLLLADVGAESGAGWAADITRTWPVSGRFSGPQADLYAVVLAAHDACIAAARPGVEYRHLHQLACHQLACGLVDLGILKGKADDLVDRNVHTLFFPHGVGHLLGLDVHDMEDLGDLAGYGPGRRRADRFGLCFLRLDRPLAEGMAVTIEPGFYQVAALLDRARQSGQYDDAVNWQRLEDFDTVRGIRIEDDLLITADGNQVLTAELPTARATIEDLVQGH
ncbi:MAG: aminopeptidase P N-terminal domain-containing protein [Cyanobacteria bacterium REEB459]|nr:aminopeptidase P N-terminal domain-containing protein [Cyanobacteria bacterium REEB459]